VLLIIIVNLIVAILVMILIILWDSFAIKYHIVNQHWEIQARVALEMMSALINVVKILFANIKILALTSIFYHL